MNRASRTLSAVLGTAALTVAAATSAGAATAAPATRTTLPGSQPAWANSAHRLSTTAGSTAVDFKVYLPWRDATAAEQLAAAVSTRGSGSTGKFLTAAQFRNRFAPSSSQVGTVRSWLASQGFKVTDVPTNNRYVEATGTVAQASTAFKTGFAEYRVQGKALRANTSALSVPSDLGATAVTGLDESYSLVRTNASPRPVSGSAGPARRTGARRRSPPHPRRTAPSCRATR